MADARATFAVELETAGVVKPGDEAANVLERLKDKIKADVAALAGMNAAMRNLKGGSSANADALKRLKDQIAAQRQSLASAQADYLNLGGRLSELTKKTVDSVGGITSLAGASQAATGPLSRLTGGLSKMFEMLGGGGKGAGMALGLAALAAIVALTAALVKVTVDAAAALFKYGIASANAARSERLHLQGLTTIRNWYGLAAGRAEDLQDSINKVSASSALGRDQIAGYAEQLYKMGLRGKNLDDALEGTAIKASVQGEQWASLFMGMAAGANMTGGSVRKLADDVRARLGGIAKAQALDLNVQIQKLHESWAQLFSGVNIEPLLKGLNEVTQLFSQNTATGKALKVLIETLFQPLIGQLGGLGSIAKNTFRYMVLGVQTVVLAVMGLLVWFKRTFGFLPTILGLIKGPFAGLLTNVRAIGPAFGMIADKIASAVAGIKDLIDAAEKLGKSFGFGDAAKDAGAATAGSFGKGVSDMISSAVAPVKDLGAKAIAALKNALDMHSPSKPMVAAGAMTSRSFAIGVDRGAPEVSRSMSDIVQIPSKIGGPGAGAGAKLGGG